MSIELEQAFKLAETPPVVKYEYRMYYDGTGKPVSMSSHNHPDGEYVLITKSHYDSANYNCKVVNGKLKFDNVDLIRIQLVKKDIGMPVVRGHANLVVENGEYEDIEYYGRNN